MGDPKGFMKIKRTVSRERSPKERVNDYKDVILGRSVKTSKEQSLRCMDCGTPVCVWGCPLGNYIPEWNDAFSKGNQKDALALLHKTNNFPEFTGKLCPAPCESGCVLGVNDDSITIRENELAIIENSFSEGLVQATKPIAYSGKSVAIIGSGPAGLACADQLSKLGHKVTVFEKDDKVGGLLRYGIPNFKFEKQLIDRRIELMEKNGVIFKTSIDVGKDISAKSIKAESDAICIAAGSRVQRDIDVEGRNLKGIHFALDYLTQATKRLSGNVPTIEALIDAKGKNVVVIGGGDTGLDCVGTANRQGAKSIVQIELLPKPVTSVRKKDIWPEVPKILKTSTSHEEGCERLWSVGTNKFLAKNGNVNSLSCVKLDWKYKDNKHVNSEIKGSEFEIKADLVLIAAGFKGPDPNLLNQFSIVADEKGNIRTDSHHMTTKKGIFAAGDARRGQSLIVWAIAEGRKTAESIHKYLSNS